VPLAALAIASVIAIAMSFGGAILLFVFVEQPSMRARSLPVVRRLTERRAKPASTGIAGQITPRRDFSHSCGKFPTPRARLGQNPA
jgi:peptidoglycan/LPS O-acetylase OafA/YrhL